MVLRFLCLIFILGSCKFALTSELNKTEIKIRRILTTNSKDKIFEKKPKDSNQHFESEISLHVELALTESEQQKGLMFRKTLAPGYGMLFVFPNEQPRQFWMKNTFLPLSIAFIDSKKTIFKIADMSPVKTLLQKEVDRAESGKPAQYVLEVPQGWFLENKIDIGSVILWPNESSYLKRK